MRSLLVLLLLVAPVAAQFEEAPEDPHAVHAPVQLLLDRFPELMDMAIVEAERDGTPDDAEALVARMEAYFAGFQDRPPWPAESEAAKTDARSSYAQVEALLHVAASIPPRVGNLAEVDADCVASREASLGQAHAWWSDAFGAANDLASFRASLRMLAAEVPAPLSGQPVVRSADILDAWLERAAGSVQFCLETIYISHGAEARQVLPDGNGTSAADTASHYMRLLVVPETAYPTGQVFVTGRVVGPLQAVTLSSEELGWSEVLQPGEDGIFSSRLVVPRDAALGSHVINATAGELGASDTLVVDRAPVQLQLTAPSRVVPGRTFTVLVHATSPLSFDPGSQMELNGDRLSVSARSAKLTAPGQERSMDVVLRYPGDGLHKEAQASASVRVVEETAPPAESRWDILEKAIWFGPDVTGGGQGGIFDRPGVARGGLLMIAMVVATAFILEFVLSARRAPERLEQGASAALQVRRWPRSFVLAFATMARYLVRHRFLPAGATPRDVGRHLAASGAPPGGLVRDFEALRYGQQSMGREEQEARSRWTWRVWKRLGGS